MKAITVFTPTFNRAHLLPRLYESLCRQTNQQFIWLVIDDGSTDCTKELIQSWMEEDKIQIHYHYKDNGGMHTGHNAAYRLIETELNVCIDSDDYMPDDAVELILKTWNSIQNKDRYAGIIGLDALSDGTIIGTEMPEGVKNGSYHELYSTNKAQGDKKFVLKTEELKKYPLYPEYENEKLVPLGILYIMMGEDKPYIFLNQILCIVEYQAGGSSNTIFKQYKQSPRGFAYARKIHIKYTPNFRKKIKSYCHLISSAIFANDFTIAYKGVNPIMVTILLPFGLLLNLFIRFKIRK